MTHPVWPLFDLAVRTERLELRYIDDALATRLARLAALGIHDPDEMPFSQPWSIVASPQLERNTLQYYWRTRAELSPQAWDINLAVLVGGQPVGVAGIHTSEFNVTRSFETGSWLGREFQGLGLGRELRVAALHLGFLGFGAQQATTRAFADNARSLGVTRSLGYQPNGERIEARLGTASSSLAFQMSRGRFLAGVKRDDITLDGVEACLDLLGLTPGG